VSIRLLRHGSQNEEADLSFSEPSHLSRFNHATRRFTHICSENSPKGAASANPGFHPGNRAAARSALKGTHRGLCRWRHLVELQPGPNRWRRCASCLFVRGIGVRFLRTSRFDLKLKVHLHPAPTGRNLPAKGARPGGMEHSLRGRISDDAKP